MTDNTMGWLDRIVDFDLGSGPWVVAAVDLRYPASRPLQFNVDLTFPDQSGGTPGFALVAANIVNPPFFPGVHVVTVADLHGNLTTSAGAHMTGFGVRNLPSSLSPGSLMNCQLWIKLDAYMPKSPFRLRFHYFTNDTFGSGDIENFVVATVRNKLKKGFRIAASLTFPQPLAGSASKLLDVTSDGDLTFDFWVSPSTLQVTGPF